MLVGVTLAVVFGALAVFFFWLKQRRLNEAHSRSLRQSDTKRTVSGTSDVATKAPNQESQCCGAAAAGTFLLRVASSALPLAAELKHDALTAARSIAGSIMRRATPAGPNGALAFPSPEEHAAPNNTTWQAGWMQGAAGMAAFLLHLYSIEAGTAGAGGRPLWPDEPDYWAA